MKIRRQTLISFGAIFLTSTMLLTNARLARADSDADDAANFGVKGNRITSNCVITGGVLTIPQIPPPPTLTNPAPCGGLVTTLDKSPSSRWSVDISWFDPITEKLYMADRNNNGVDIIDAKTETVVGIARGTVGIQPTYTPPSPFPNPNPLGFAKVAVANNSGPNGIVVVNNGSIHQLWIGDGVKCQNVLNGTTIINVTCAGTSNVLVYNLDAKGLPTTSTPFVTLSSTGLRRADELAYDPDDQLILMAWDDDLDLFINLISVSNTAGNIKVVKKIALPEADGCGIEQPVYDSKSNRFYLAVPCTSDPIGANGAIYVINPKTQKVEIIYPTVGKVGNVDVPCFPHGLALGPRQNLLLGCSGDGTAGTQMISIIMKATTGKVLQTFNQLGGSDEVYYNKGDNTYFLAMSSWTSSGKTATGNPTPSLGIIDAGSSDTGNEAPEWIQNILTTRTSHSVAAGYGFRCDNDDHGRSHCDRREGNEGNDVVRKHAFVPLTTIPIPLSSTATINEQGGIGVYGRVR